MKTNKMHEAKVLAVEKALKDLFNCTLVSSEETFNDLQGVQNLLGEYMNALREEAKRKVK